MLQKRRKCKLYFGLTEVDSTMLRSRFKLHIIDWFYNNLDSNGKPGLLVFVKGKERDIQNAIDELRLTDLDVFWLLQ